MCGELVRNHGYMKALGPANCPVIIFKISKEDAYFNMYSQTEFSEIMTFEQFKNNLEIYGFVKSSKKRKTKWTNKERNKRNTLLSYLYFLCFIWGYYWRFHRNCYSNGYEAFWHYITLTKKQNE